MEITYDSDVNEKVSSLLTESVETLNTGFGNTLLSDFSPFTQVGLFTTQLNNLKKGIDTLVKSYESLNSNIQSNKYEWTVTDQEIGDQISGIGSYGGGGSRYSGGGGGGNSTYSGSQYVSDIVAGLPIKISDQDVSSLIGKLDGETTIALLKRIYKLKGNNDIIEMLTDEKYSGLLTSILKKILGDTSTELSTERTAESDAIQKALLEKVNTNNCDITTEDGKSQLEKQVLENINNSTVSEDALNTLIYGDNTKVVSMLDGNWVVADTKYDLSAYASYISNSGVRQNIDTAKYGDSCLAFSYVHAYDLFTGNKDSAAAAGNYAHASCFQDYINDDKSAVLSKIYDEIMNGRPVVLQVNGNKQGTSRHFVTVVGFKEGVTSGSDLQESDLLIVDSWDGKVERMDTSSSRFMTTGKAVGWGNEYTGYRLRVLKQDVA